MDYTLRPATTADSHQINQVLRAAFTGPDEAELVRRLRASDNMVLELIAQSSDLAGYVAISKMVAPLGWLVLAPLAVLPDAQGQGIGSELARAALRFAVDEIKAPICVLGKVDFYERQGFSQKRAAGLQSRYPIKSTMLAGPGDEVPTGKLTYSSAFDVV